MPCARDRRRTLPVVEHRGDCACESLEVVARNDGLMSTLVVVRSAPRITWASPPISTYSTPCCSSVVTIARGSNC